MTSAIWPELFVDDHPLLDALRARGIDTGVATWDDPSVRWGDAELLVLRSIWDYTAHRDAFVRWAEETERVVPMHNPARIVRWNSHKQYLRDLDREGIPVIPTVWIDAGTTADAAAIAAERGWGELVAKPCVSAGARGAVRGDAATVQQHIDALVPEHDLMLQPYVRETEGAGEHSLVHLGGNLSHVMRKDPALVGGTYSSSSVVPAEPHPDELALAARVLEVTGPLLYARVDAVVIDERAHVMEIELIEPQLFLRQAPGAADRMADLIVADLG